MKTAYPEYIRQGAIPSLDAPDERHEGPIIPLARHILRQAFSLGASDIHLEPGARQMEVRCRIDGVLQPLLRLPRNLQDRRSTAGFWRRAAGRTTWNTSLTMCSCQAPSWTGLDSSGITERRS